MADMAQFANLNLSGEVKGRALGMRLKYPRIGNYRAARLYPTFSFKSYAVARVLVMENHSMADAKV